MKNSSKTCKKQMWWRRSGKRDLDIKAIESTQRACYFAFVSEFYSGNHLLESENHLLPSLQGVHAKVRHAYKNLSVRQPSSTFSSISQTLGTSWTHRQLNFIFFIAKLQNTLNTLSAQHKVERTSGFLIRYLTAEMCFYTGPVTFFCSGFNLERETVSCFRARRHKHCDT